MNSDFSDPMDASLLQLERELHSLTPAAPRRELVRTLNACMAPVARNVPANKVHAFPWRRMVTPAAAAAAAVAVMSLEYNRRAAHNKSVAGVSEKAAPSIKWEPMPMRSEYRELLDAGYVFTEDFNLIQEPQNNYQWNNQNGSTSNVTLSMPRPQRLIVPANRSGLREGGRRLQFD